MLVKMKNVVVAKKSKLKKFRKRKIWSNTVKARITINVIFSILTSETWQIKQKLKIKTSKLDRKIG